MPHTVLSSAGKNNGMLQGRGGGGGICLTLKQFKYIQTRAGRYSLNHHRKW